MSPGASSKRLSCPGIRVGCQEIGICKDMVPRHLGKAFKLWICLLNPGNELANVRVESLDCARLIGETAGREISIKNCNHARFGCSMTRRVWVANARQCRDLPSMIQHNLKSEKEAKTLFFDSCVVVLSRLKEQMKICPLSEALDGFSYLGQLDIGYLLRTQRVVSTHMKMGS